MHQAATDLFQLLVQAGAIPGEDFSCDAAQQACHLNARCFDLLQQAYPEVDWVDVLGAPYAHVEAIRAGLCDRLGVDFFAALSDRMAARLATLRDRQAASYVQHLLSGVETATGIAVYPFLRERLDLAGQLRLEWLVRQPISEPLRGEWLADVARAAGASDADCSVCEGDLWLAESALERLSWVWQDDVALMAEAPAPKTR